MSKMKKWLSAGLVVTMVAAIAISGTLAYLTSEDSDVNVMTLGNVNIEQHEYERVVNADGSYEMVTVTKADGSTQESYKVQPFTQNKPLYPATGEVTYWDSTYVRWEQLGDPSKVNGGQAPLAGLNNIQDKFVMVENTGKSDAYVRTIIAFELGDVAVDEWEKIIQPVYAENGEPWIASSVGAVTVNENNFYVMEFIYNGYSWGNMRHKGGILPAGEWTYSSLAQVYMTSAATNEDVEAIDGNDNGTYDILVLSQAVQTEGFADAQTALDTGFGDVNAENAAKWFSELKSSAGFEVSNNEELAAAIESGETEIWLNAGTYHMPESAKGKTLTIGGTKDSIIEVVPCNTPGAEANGQLDYSLDGSTVTFNGVTIKTNSQLYAGFARLSATYNDCVIQNTYNLGTGVSAFNNCEINITNEYLRVNGAYSASFTGCTFNTDGRAILVFQDGNSVDQTVTVKDCTFNATAPATTWNGIHITAVSIDGSQGGSYNVSFEGNNVVGDNFAGLCQIKNQKDNNVTIHGATVTPIS